MVVLILVAFIAGLVTAISPCVLPILPIVLATGADGDRRRPYLVILGLIASFTFFTLASVQIISALGLPSSVLRDIAIAIIAIFGLTLLVPALSEVFERATGRLQRAGAALMTPATPGPLVMAAGVGGSQSAAPARRGSVVGGLLTGVGLGLVWTPCAGPILGAITSLAVTAPGSWSTLVLVFTYSLGAGLPLLAIAQGGRVTMARLRMRSASKWATRVFGVIVIATAGLMAVGADTALSADLTSTLPNWTDTLQSLERSNPVQAALNQVEGHGRPTGQPASNGSALSDLGPAPEFTGIDHWLNSKPLTLADLRGKVVLVDFWTYSCVNCVRTLPYLRAWYDAYKDKGLVIVGVHSPEFEFEKVSANVSRAMGDLGVTWPVVQDNDYAQWNAYGNQYWPAHYFIDAKGRVRYFHFGEGAYDVSERVIQALLKEAGAETSGIVSKVETKLEDRTPETYLGYERGKLLQSAVPPEAGKVVDYKPGKDLGNGEWSLDGKWKIEDQYVVSESDGILDFRFNAKSVYLVIEPEGRGGSISVSMDGAPVQDTSDVKKGFVKPTESRLYQLVKLPSGGEHLLRLVVSGRLRLFAFTFG